MATVKFYIYSNSIWHFYLHLGKYDSHLFKILLENFYGKNILDRIGAIENNNNENETEPSVQSVSTQKREDAWLDGDIDNELNQEYLNENMFGTHRDWKRALEVILRGFSITVMVKIIFCMFMNVHLNASIFKY